MATRFYMSSDVFSVVSIATQGTWGSTVGDHEKLYMYDTNPGDMSFILESYSGGGAGTHKWRTFVTEPLAAGINFSTATFTWNCRYGESSTSANAFSLFHVAIVSEDGTTTRAEFSASEKDSTEFTASTSTPASRNNTAAAGSLNYTTVAGDRMVVEVGWDQDGSGSYTIVASRGNTSGTDLSSTDGDTDIQNPWFETSATITYDAGGEDPPPATNEDWDATIYISAYLDEWV